jgi:acyl dehydratase
LFRSFAKLAEQAGDGRPLLRGLRVAQDPTTDRIVIVHGGARVEFVLVPGTGDSLYANVECRRMDSIGATETMPIASFRFDETGNVSQSSVPELVNENVSEAKGAWSIVGAVIWNAMQEPG